MPNHDDLGGLFSDAINDPISMNETLSYERMIVLRHNAPRFRGVPDPFHGSQYALRDECRVVLRVPGNIRTD